MSKKAIQIHSNINGLFSPIKSSEIRSREDARKKGPFIDNDNKLVYWVKPSYDTKFGKFSKVSHFRHYPFSQSNRRKISLTNFNKEIDSKHLVIQNNILAVLNEMIKKKEKLIWHFVDKEFSDFSLSGDLLREVKSVDKEYSINIKPVKKQYRFDIVLLGKKIRDERVVLGAIELENTHEASIEKTLLCKSIGFPLLTIDISEIEPNNISEKLCKELLIESTSTSDNSRRRNFYYIHNILQPIFLVNYKKYLPDDDGHQYIVFFHQKSDREVLIEWLKVLSKNLELDNKNDYLIQPVNINKNDNGALSMQSNDICLMNSDFSEYDNTHYLRIILKRPKNNSNLYIYHLILSKLLTLHLDCLVGYKFKKNYCQNTDLENKYWNVGYFENIQKGWVYKKFCPKELSEPIYQILRKINEIEQ